MKKKVRHILGVSNQKGDLSWWIDVFLILLISINVLVIILESVEPIKKKYFYFFEIFEIISVIIFTIEYLLRVWSANADTRYKTPFFGNLKYCLSPLALIDLLAIIPFYLPFIGLDLRLLRMLRMFRLFRIFKIARYIKALIMIKEVLRNKKEELFISLVFTLFMLLISSTLMYYIENEVQPEAFSSIPETMWWGIATLTTVGYGDVYPITGIGKFLAGLIAILGIGLFALPTGILASGFSEELSKSKKEKDSCPTCGK